MARPAPESLDQFPAYGIWVHQVALYAEVEKKRLMGLKPFDSVGCRAARAVLIRDLAEPRKQRKRYVKVFEVIHKEVFEQSGKERENARFGSDDVITNLFVNENKTPATFMDPAELIEKPYAYFRPTNPSKKRHKRHVSRILLWL
ncbi:unnamed protein product [Cylicostephanus goldi]|uniref:Uncharacterized protein n=1 Tax=Cylicostephanus goldi TaxID=71465 RepID=A0A3P7N6Z0_CYLGO|nr:unnamed protein product [Cylicostephanus goldi]